MESQQHTRVGVGVWVEKDGKVLMMHRKGVHGSGTWSMPGGHLDFGETPEQCAIRETKEETDVDIDNVHFVAMTNDYFEHSNKHYITIWMKGSYKAGTAKVNAAYESSAVEWFSWNELPSPLFAPFEKLLSGDSYPKNILADLKITESR